MREERLFENMSGSSLLSQLVAVLSRGSVFRVYPDDGGSAQDKLVYYSVDDGRALCMLGVLAV